MSETDTTTITTGELSRAVTLIRGDIKDVKKDISERPTIGDYKDLRAEVDKKASNDAITYARERIQSLEEWQKWAMRIGVPALMGVLVNLANTLDGKIP